MAVDKVNLAIWVDRRPKILIVPNASNQVQCSPRPIPYVV